MSRNAWWIAADFVKAARPTVWVMAFFLMLILPAQMGFVDGAFGPGKPSWFCARLWILTGAIWPAVLFLSLFGEVFFPRKLRRELEPLLAAPVTDRDLVAGHALPVAACHLLYVLVGIPLMFVTYRLTAGRYPQDLIFEIVFLVIGSTMATLMMGAGMLDALFHAGSLGGFAVRSILPILPLMALDFILSVLRFFDLPWLSLALVSAGAAAGGWAVLRVHRRLDRELLIVRS